MRLELDSEKYEHFRRALMLADIALDALVKEHPDDWKERLRLAARQEFEVAGATVDDYLISHKRAVDSIV